MGGRPAFSEPLHVGRPNIGDRAALLARINDLLDRRWLTNNGPFVQEFEQRVADFLGVKHCIAMCNATVALEIATRALGLHGEVIVPSFTFIATAHALQWQEITPVFCDVDPATHNLDPAKVEAMITPRTTGIIGVHVWGRPCAIEALSEIAERRGLKLMFDAAHAFGCSYKGRMIGNFGEAEVFSFHATKFFNTFEGGAVVTNDDDLAAKIRLMKNFGFAGYDNVIYVGTNGKMSEVSAAMGLTGLESLDEFIAANRRNYAAYRAGLAGRARRPAHRLRRGRAQQLPVRDRRGGRGGSRHQPRRPGACAPRRERPGPALLLPRLPSRWSRIGPTFPHAGLLLPETERLTQRVMSLPTGTAVGPEEIDSHLRHHPPGRQEQPGTAAEAGSSPGEAASMSAASPDPTDVKVSVAMITYNHERSSRRPSRACSCSRPTSRLSSSSAKTARPMARVPLCATMGNATRSESACSCPNATWG